jgi:hypothetical protein
VCRRLDAGEIAYLLQWVFITPLALALAIGKGFGKPDFWARETALTPFLALRPLRSGDWILLKLKVAALSAALAWLPVLMLGVPWIFRFADLSRLRPWLPVLLQSAGPSGPVAFMALCLLPLVPLVLLTWRLLIAGTWSGVSMRTGVLPASVAGTLVVGMTSLMTFVWFQNHPGQGRQWSSWVDGVTVFLTAALVGKAVLAARGWTGVLRRRLAHPESVFGFLNGWGTAALSSVFLAMAAISPEAGALPVLGALLFWPNARISHAILALEQNRHSGAGHRDAGAR